MPKARNGVRYSSLVKKQAQFFRTTGMTHREIAKKLGARVSTVHLWTKEIHITHSQKQSIEARRNHHRMSAGERKTAGKRLAPYQYKIKYSDDELVEKIKDFYTKNGRIPLKREFNALRIYRLRFGSWNEAIKRAGFETNPVLFAKKFIASDGHLCDSFTEKVIDDWFTEKGIEHERHFSYKNSRFTADFKIGPDVLVEFFGLAGVQKAYDKNIGKKRLLAKELGYQLIEIYPNDIYPKNKLPVLLRDIIRRLRVIA